MRNRDIAIGAGLLLLLSRTRKAAGSTVLAPPQSGKNFAQAWAERATALNKRGAGGNPWVARMTALLGNAPAGVAAGRWIGIESGGDPRNESKLNERGLAQVSKQSLKELGLTEADYVAMASARTTDDAHAALAAKVIGGEMLVVSKSVGVRAPDPGWGPPVGPSAFYAGGDRVSVNGIGIAKLRHGLPLLVRELKDQGHLRVTIPLTIRSALTGAIGAGTPKPRFKPSARLAAFATPVTGNVAADLLLRFLCSAAVVAHGTDAIVMGEAFSEGVS
jgi:hypothetical protein